MNESKRVSNFYSIQFERVLSSNEGVEEEEKEEKVLK